MSKHGFPAKSVEGCGKTVNHDSSILRRGYGAKWGLPLSPGAYCYSDHGATIDTFAGLGRLSDNCSGFKLEIVQICQNTDVEIRIAHPHLARLVVQADDSGHRCLWRS
jgi:hypothetical protein